RGACAAAASCANAGAAVAMSDANVTVNVIQAKRNARIVPSTYGSATVDLFKAALNVWNGADVADRLSCQSREGMTFQAIDGGERPEEWVARRALSASTCMAIARPASASRLASGTTGAWGL